MNLYSTDIEIVHSVLLKEFKKYRTPVVDLIRVQTNDPFKILITTILSARTRDEVTAAAAERLFEVISSFDDIDKNNIKTIEKLIYPVGFYHDKATNLKKIPETIRDKFDGKIPQTVEELTELPGVGRKTANLVVAIAFDKPAICVDTHVHRICNRLGYLITKSPLQTEMVLREHLPVKLWKKFNSCFVAFGQNTCTPVNPHCNKCPILHYCDRIGVKTKFPPQ